MASRPLPAPEVEARKHLFVVDAIRARDDQFRAILRATAKGFESKDPANVTRRVVAEALRAFADAFVDRGGSPPTGGAPAEATVPGSSDGSDASCADSGVTA